MRRRRGEDGQAASEYVALVLLVAVALALAAGLTSGGVGGQVLAGVQRGLCRVAGTACRAPRPSARDLAPCPLERTTSAEAVRGALELVALGGGATLTAVRRSDGRVTISLLDRTTLGVETGAALEATSGRRHGLDATAGGELRIASGRAWTLPSAAAARAFVAQYGSKATVGGRAVDLVRSGCSLLCDAIGWRPHAQLPPPDELYMDHGAAVRLDASLGRWHVLASGGALLGARLSRDGTNTAFLQLDAAVGGELAGGASAGAGVQRQAVLSYTRDARGRPSQLVIHTVVREAARAGLRAGDRTRAGAGGSLAHATETDATLDLRDARNRAAAVRLLGALGHPLALAELRSSAAAVRERIARAGVVDRRTYALAASGYELGAKVALGAELGASFEHTREGMRLLSARTRLPGLPFLPRDDCRPA